MSSSYKYLFFSKYLVIWSQEQHDLKNKVQVHRSEPRQIVCTCTPQVTRRGAQVGTEGAITLGSYKGQPWAGEHLLELDFFLRRSAV